MTTTIEDARGDRYYLVEVIGLMLNCIKDQLIFRIEKAGKRLVATDFKWVITIPAIWKGRGKQLIREAAYRVCDNLPKVYISILLPQKLLMNVKHLLLYSIVFQDWHRK